MYACSRSLCAGFASPQIVTPQGYGVDARVCISTETVMSSPSAEALSNIYASILPDMIRATSS